MPIPMPKNLLVACLWLALIAEIRTKPAPDASAGNASTPMLAIDTGNNEIESEYRAQYAKLMLTYMNQSVDPCDDFYEYACGNWKNVIEERQALHKRSNLLDIIYRLNDAIGALLLETPADELGTEYAAELKLAQQFYRSCLAADLQPVKRSETYLEVIKSIGGFPAVDETWRADNFSWLNMSAHLSNYGALGLFKEELIQQYPFPPYVKLPELGFDYIVHSDNIDSNGSHVLNEKRMHKYLAAYGVDEAKREQIVTDIVDFWRAVLNITDQFDEDNDKCRQLTEIFKVEQFDQWSSYTEIAWDGLFDLSDYIWPCDYFYVELDKVCNERKEAVANYLALKFIYAMDARLEDKKFQKDYCAMMMHNSLPYVIDKLYQKQYFNTEIREEVTQIVNQLRKSLREALEAADWLDESTRAEALLKEATLKTYIGSYVDNEMIDRLIKEMKNLTFLEDNYEQNNVNLKKYRMRVRRYNGLHHKELDANSTKPLELLMSMQINAFYYNVDNSIYVMAGILHPPSYHKSWPYALKYGTIGYLVGHEFTHGFDSVGAIFDGEGEERYWWSNKSGKVFDERAQCYVDHFNSYKIPEINRYVDGNNTKDENIADSGGLRESLSAYRRYMKELNLTAEKTLDPKDEQMPGVDLLPEQLYFLGFAQLWCASYKEEHYWEELTNEHTMDKYRVLGAVTNFEEFSKAYNCSVGSKMNPKTDKCRVW